MKPSALPAAGCMSCVSSDVKNRVRSSRGREGICPYANPWWSLEGPRLAASLPSYLLTWSLASPAQPGRRLGKVGSSARPRYPLLPLRRGSAPDPLGWSSFPLLGQEVRDFWLRTRAASGDVSARAVRHISYPTRVLLQFPIQASRRELLQPGPIRFPSVNGGRASNLSPVPQLPPCSGFTSALLRPYSEETLQCQLPCWRVANVGRDG